MPATVPAAGPSIGLTTRSQGSKIKPNGRFYPLVSMLGVTSVAPPEPGAWMAGTKGMQTRRRIVELAAPVFNRQGYVGAPMRDRTGATGLEKGGIHNHFGSKGQLALEP